MADAATLKFQDHVISGTISWGQIADVYSSTAQIGQVLVLIIKAWNRKIQMKFEKLKMKKNPVRETDREESGEVLARVSSMDESFEEISSEVFDIANQTEKESGIQGESNIHDSFVSTPVMFLQRPDIKKCRYFYR